MSEDIKELCEQLRAIAVAGAPGVMMSAVRERPEHQAADTIEALQQRCEELEAYSRGLIGRQDVTMGHLQDEIQEQQKHIAAFKAALREIQDLEINGVSNIARVALEGQALTSSEGAGECWKCPKCGEEHPPEIRSFGCPNCDTKRVWPIHAPTSSGGAGEEIEKADGRIAALEAALGLLYNAARDMRWRLGGMCPPDNLLAIDQASQALTSSEGAGECTCYPSITYVERDPNCPIHSPTSAAEGREDGRHKMR